MSHYICRLLDESGQEVGVVPIIASVPSEAVATARRMFRVRAQPGAFEVWIENTRYLHEDGPELVEAGERNSAATA